MHAEYSSVILGPSKSKNCSDHWCRGTIGNNDVPIYTLEPFLYCVSDLFLLVRGQEKARGHNPDLDRERGHNGDPEKVTGDYHICTW